MQGSGTQALRKTGSGCSLDENNLERLFWRENHAVRTRLAVYRKGSASVAPSQTWRAPQPAVRCAKLFPHNKQPCRNMQKMRTGCGAC